MEIEKKYLIPEIPSDLKIIKRGALSKDTFARIPLYASVGMMTVSSSPINQKASWCGRNTIFLSLPVPMNICGQKSTEGSFVNSPCHSYRQQPFHRTGCLSG